MIPERPLPAHLWLSSKLSKSGFGFIDKALRYLRATLGDEIHRVIDEVELGLDASADSARQRFAAG